MSPSDFDDSQASFWEHLAELRLTLLRILCTITAGLILSLLCYTQILSILLSPLDQPLALLDPLEGMKTTLAICFWLSFVGTSPVWLYFVLQFIAPAIEQTHRRLLFPFFGLSLLFLGAGFLFAQMVTLPLANRFLYAFNEEIGTNFWSYALYIDYTLLLFLANGLAFELTLLLFFFVHIGLLSASFMRSHRRAVILLAFILGALLTPPDVLTQLLLALPLIGLYELAIIYASFRSSSSTFKI